MIALCREETGIFVMELSEHLWPEDLELAIPAVHDSGRNRQNLVLLLVKVANSYETSPWDVLSQILQPGILPQNRPFRVAVLTTTGEDRECEIRSKQIPGVQIRSFSLSQAREAKAWLLSFATPESLPPILG